MRGGGVEGDFDSEEAEMKILGEMAGFAVKFSKI